jgi:hypothetical protein
LEAKALRILRSWPHFRHNPIAIPRLSRSEVTCSYVQGANWPSSGRTIRSCWFTNPGKSSRCRNYS